MMLFNVFCGLAIALLSAEVEAFLPRPPLVPFPFGFHSPKPWSPPRLKVCFVKARGKGQDDAANFLQSFHSCNNGGTVVLDGNYTIGSPLDLTFLNAVDIVLTGTVNIKPDVAYWTQNHFYYAFQNSYASWRIGGNDVNIFGGGVGTINGNGQVWWDAYVTNSSEVRPLLLVLDGLKSGSVTGLKMINPANWFNLVANSSHVLISDMHLSYASVNSNTPKNTDGWDTFRSDNIVIQNSIIDNTDDCVSFKPNSTNIVVQGLSCNGSHGISVGSLGQYQGEVDIVENILVYNISMSNAGDGARLKVWPGLEGPTAAYGTGGGSGYVKNVTYDTIKISNVDWTIEVNQCYGTSNTTLCQQYPSNMTMSDVYFKNMWGVTSKKYDPKVGTLVCSSPEKCINFEAHNITVTPPSGKAPTWVCNGLDTSQLQGFTCVPS